MTSLRPYQVAARDAVYRSWVDYRSTLLVLATGTGKTYTAGEILRERATVGRILWLAHRMELLEQATDTLAERIGLSCELEKAEARAKRHGLFGVSDVVVGSVQTLSAKRLRSWPRDAFQTIVVDEAHHATARTYRGILEHFHDAKVLGLTATPDRGDGVGLGAIFDDVAYQYDIRTAIREGYLCPIVQKSVEVADIDLSDVKTTAGDLNAGQLAAIMEAEGALHGIAAPLAREIGTRPTILFTASVEQAKALASILDGYGIRASEVNGETPREIRSERLDDFRTGKIRVLANCAVLTEGFDAPETACVAMARPTKSRSLYTQCVGRGTRLAPGKADCLVLDFVGNAGRHRLINPLDVLAGKPLPEDLAERARQLAEEGKPSEEALAQAEAEAIEREREAERRRAREAKIRAEVAYRASFVDPFGIVSREPPPGAPGASHAQLEYLERMGVDVSKMQPTKAAASQLIDMLQQRRRDGLCRYRQARVLAKHGLRTDVSFTDASKIIDAIARNGWRCPDDVKARWGA